MSERKLMMFMMFVLYVYMYICFYIYMVIHVCLCMFICLYMFVCLYMHVYNMTICILHVIKLHHCCVAIPLHSALCLPSASNRLAQRLAQRLVADASS